MPTIFSHAIFAEALGTTLGKNQPARFWILTALCAVLPDADVIAFNFAMERGSMFTHRGITHSIFFAIILGCAVSALFGRSEISRWKLALYFATATVSHPLLDMLTNGGSGVALFAPLSSERFFSPWRPIEVSPIGLGFFSERGLSVILSEVIWIWIPSAAIVAITLILRWLQRR